jgi:hypothetical protein
LLPRSVNRTPHFRGGNAGFFHIFLNNDGSDLTILMAIGPSHQDLCFYREE